MDDEMTPAVQAYIESLPEAPAKLIKLADFMVCVDAETFVIGEAVFTECGCSRKIKYSAGAPAEVKKICYECYQRMWLDGKVLLAMRAPEEGSRFCERCNEKLKELENTICGTCHAR